MRKVYVSAVEFLRMCEREFGWSIEQAVLFIKACRDAGVNEARLAQPARERFVYVQIPKHPIWLDNVSEDDKNPEPGAIEARLRSLRAN